MLRTRSGWLVATVAALGIGASACKKDDKSGAGGAGGPMAAMGAASDLSLLPADSEIVIGLNFSQLQQSALWKQYSPAVMANASKELNEFKTTCGFDPFAVVKSVAIGLKGVDGSSPTGAVVVHGLDKDKVVTCLKSDKVKTELAKDGSSIVEDGGVYLGKDQDGTTPAGFTFVSGDTMFVSFAKSGVTKDSVLAAAKGDAGLKSSKQFLDMYGKVNTKDSLWGFVNGNASFMKEAAGMGVKAQAVFGSLNVTDGLAVDVRIRSATPDEAKGTVDLLKSQTSNDQVKQMFDKLDVSQDGSDARIQIAMSQAKLQQLTQLFGGMLGGMLGGGMGGGGMGAPTP
jgi:hypothetical protein